MNSAWKKLTHTDMKKFLSELADSAELWVPQKVNDRWRFEPYDPQKEITFPESIIHVSAKQLFFSKRRVIARFDTASDWSMTTVAAPDTARIIMGLHPCDVASIEYIDRVFLNSEHKDTLYEAERNRTVLIGMLCEEMESYCHCTDRGLSPDRTEGMDVVFAKSKDGYLFRALTTKGQEIVDSALLQDTADVPEKKQWPAGRYAIASAEEFMEMYDDDIWKELSDICLTCGICTFSCPTCVCFLIADEKHKGKGERVTVWDSCQLTAYSRMAGGHNARKKAANRVRNRTLDKFAYSKLRHGTISCTGCGRCAIVCPIGRSFPQAAARVSAKIEEKKAKKMTTPARRT